MEMVHNPYSLFASAMEEVSKCYKFSPLDTLSIVRNIDYYPLENPIRSPELGFHRHKDHQNTPNQVLYKSARQFMTRRRDLMDVICGILAKSIVHFNNKDDIKQLDLTEARARYLKYSNLLAILDKAEVHLDVDDDIQNLLEHIREERAKMKRIDAFVNQTCCYSGFQFDSDFGWNENIDYNDLGDGDKLDHREMGNGLDYDKIECADIDGVCEKLKVMSLKENKHPSAEKTAVLPNHTVKEYNIDDNATALYGLIGH